MIQSAASGLSRLGADCGSACAGGFGILSMFHLNSESRVAEGLADVRAQIRADQQARAARARSI